MNPAPRPVRAPRGTELSCANWQIEAAYRMLQNNLDPEVAEAVAHEPGSGGEPVVAEVLRSGYRWKGKTLRPAMVKTTD